MSAVPTDNYRSITTTETAKLIRTLMKNRFPEVKVKVHSHRYAGGSSIDVKVDFQREDNPERWDEIISLLDGFTGQGFDGMIDMTFYKHSWLNPDGTATLAKHTGTQGSGGSYEAVDNPAPDEKSEFVHFHANHVFLSYDWSSAR